MSRETMQWLNNNTLIGYTEKRGRAWHYRAENQGQESNHYNGPIPVADVERRLFNWTAVEGSLTATALTLDGVLTHSITDRKAIMRSDTGSVLGIFSGGAQSGEGYRVHQFKEWLLDTVARILDDSLNIGSAGLLKGGAVAWVSVEVPDTVKTPEGVEFRPHLLATTSHDGSIATQFGRKVQLAVCDNTLSVALGEQGQKFKVKHTKYSNVKLNDARSALEIVHTISDDFAKQVSDLCAITVTDGDWSKFLNSLAPLTDPKRGNAPLEGRSLTMAQNKRDGLDKMYRYDNRVAPWNGTAFGVVQCVNTFTHHEGIVRGESRADRNMLRAIDGGVDKLDRSTYDTLMAVMN